MATSYDVLLRYFVIRKNQSLLFLKKNPNLARIISFTFCYQLNITTKCYKRNVIIVFYCLLIFIHSSKKVQNAQKLVANLAYN